MRALGFAIDRPSCVLLLWIMICMVEKFFLTVGLSIRYRAKFSQYVYMYNSYRYMLLFYSVHLSRSLS